jgi:hypothetical protein
MITVYRDLEQGSADWFKARAGIPTASEFSTVLARGKGGGVSLTRKKYLLTLAGERLTGECVESYSNAHMERGKAMEAEARDLYAFQTDAELERVGFVRNEEWNAGGSPDSLIGDDGGIEIKTALPHIQLERLIENELPSEHKAQCQGILALTGRSWIDFVSYWPKLPIFVKRVERDERYIAELKIAVQEFNSELNELVRKFQ